MITTTCEILRFNHNEEDSAPVLLAEFNVTSNDDILSMMMSVIKSNGQTSPLTKTDDFELSDGFRYYYQAWC